MKKQIFNMHYPNERIPVHIPIERSKPSILTGVCRICGSPILRTSPKRNRLCMRCQMGVIKTDDRRQQ